MIKNTIDNFSESEKFKEVKQCLKIKDADSEDSLDLNHMCLCVCVSFSNSVNILLM